MDADPHTRETVCCYGAEPYIVSNHRGDMLYAAISPVFRLLVNKVTNSQTKSPSSVFQCAQYAGGQPGANSFRLDYTALASWLAFRFTWSDDSSQC